MAESGNFSATLNTNPDRFLFEFDEVLPNHFTTHTTVRDRVESLWTARTRD